MLAYRKATAFPLDQQLTEKPGTAKEFRNVFAHRFIITNAANERQRWARIVQSSTLTEDIEKFNQQFIRILNASKGEKVQRFVEGLKIAAKTQLIIQTQQQ